MVKFLVRSMVAYLSLPRVNSIATNNKQIVALLSLLKTALSAMSREHRNLVADFALVMRSLAGARLAYPYERLTLAGEVIPSAENVGLEGLEQFANDINAPYNNLSALEWGERFLPSNLRDHLSYGIRKFNLTRTVALAGRRNLVPRRYMYLDDLNKNNFTAFSAGSALSFTKFLLDAFTIFVHQQSEEAPSARLLLIGDFFAQARYATVNSSGVTRELFSFESRANRVNFNKNLYKIFLTTAIPYFASLRRVYNFFGANVAYLIFLRSLKFLKKSIISNAQHKSNFSQYETFTKTLTALFFKRGRQFRQFIYTLDRHILQLNTYSRKLIS